MWVGVRLKCSRLRVSVWRRRPVGYVPTLRGLVRRVALRCRVCDGRVVVKVGRAAG